MVFTHGKNPELSMMENGVMIVWKAQAPTITLQANQVINWKAILKTTSLTESAPIMSAQQNSMLLIGQMANVLSWRNDYE